MSARAATYYTGRCTLPANADCCLWLTRAFTTLARNSVQVSAHEHICHDDGPAAEHDVGFALDFGFARYLIASVLVAMLVGVHEFHCTRDSVAFLFFHPYPMSSLIQQKDLPFRCIRPLLICA